MLERKQPNTYSEHWVGCCADVCGVVLPHCYNISKFKMYVCPYCVGFFFVVLFRVVVFFSLSRGGQSIEEHLLAFAVADVLPVRGCVFVLTFCSGF